MLGLADSYGHWLRQQWATLSHLNDVNGWDVAFAAAVVLIILVCWRCA